MAFTIELPAGYRARDPQRYFGRDPASTSERVTSDGTIRKAVWLANRAAELRIAFGPQAATCEIVTEFALRDGDLARARGAAIRMLGLHGDPAVFAQTFGKDPILSESLRRRPTLRIPLTAHPFEAVIWAIVGQQINLRFASKLREVVGELAGTPTGSGLVAQPEAVRLATVRVADLRARQFSRSKAEYLVAAARAIADGMAYENLIGVRGIGLWTSRYVELRGLGKLDSAPIGDSGVAAALRKALGRADRVGSQEAARILECFAPFRSFATAHLWAMLAEESANAPRPLTTNAAVPLRRF